MTSFTHRHTGSRERWRH